MRRLHGQGVPAGDHGRGHRLHGGDRRRALARGAGALSVARAQQGVSRAQQGVATARAKHVLVTGAGTGIGRAIALRLARDGYALSLAARTKSKLDATAREIAKAGGAAPLVLALDIRERAAVDRAFARAAKVNGPLHALVANAGIGGANAPGAKDRFAELVATNLNGTYHCLRAAERHLAAGPDARHLVVNASVLARIGVAGYTGYCASKTGLLGLVRALAMELAPQNVQVNALCPGWVDTEMAREGLAGMAKALKTDVAGAKRIAMQAVPLGRMSQPEDVAGLVAWLLSKDARGVTGQAIDMNGGAFMS
ncbi:MAG: SDR family oxidoreductase [Planctomycetota bacterium]|nr:MAG: SDR family oxidoreductase [Planctomycetota bacterium]